MSLPLSYLDLPDIEEVDAIRIASAGEVASHGLPKISVIEISSSDPVFSPKQRQISKISQLIGIPIAGRKLLSETDLQGARSEHLNVSNTEATLLFQNINIAAPDHVDVDGSPSPFDDFGWAPEYWQFSVGPVVIARLDKKPLHPLHASAFIKFCQGYICAKVEEMVELLNSESSWSQACQETRTSLEQRQRIREARQTVIDECTREKFEEYFKTYKMKRVNGVRMSRFDLSFEVWDVPEHEKQPRPEWRKVGSPYDV